MSELDDHITKEIFDIIRRAGHGGIYTPSTWIHINTTKHPIWIIADNGNIHIEIGGLIGTNTIIELSDINAFDRMLKLIARYEK